MTELLRQHEIDTLRIVADKAGCNGQVEAGRILHGLLDTLEDSEKKDAKREEEVEDLEKERDKFSDALKEARGMLERIEALAKTADTANALERHGEIRLLAEEAIEDIAGVFDE